MAPASELLTRYARDGDQSAFTEVVGTHLDLVYSAALRRVGGDRHAAAEIAQDVFTALARHAGKLARHPVLNAWLHTATRHAAVDFHRRAQRRQRQHEPFGTMDELPVPPAPTSDWSHVRDVLDPALDELNELDRRVLILRFFENRSFGDIAATVGLREDAARMRASRALDRLRVGLGRRGIASTAAALGGLLSAHAITTAPAALISTVAAAATTGSAASIAGAGGAFQLMSTMKTAVSIAGLALCAGVAAFVYYQRDPAAATHAPAPEVKPHATEIARAAAPALSLDSLVREQKERAVSAATLAAEEKVAVLRDMFARLPDQSIPELKLATNSDWHTAVDGPLETIDDYRRALAKLRSLAEARFARLAQPALREYLRTAKNFPTEATQLASFADAAIDRSMLERYRIAASSEIPNVRMGGDHILTQNHLIDSEYDTHLVIGPNGFGSCSSLHSTAAREWTILMPAIQAFRAAQGRAHDDLTELAPYATTAEQKAVVEKRLAKKSKAAPNP